MEVSSSALQMYTGYLRYPADDSMCITESSPSNISPEVEGDMCI